MRDLLKSVAGASVNDAIGAFHASSFHTLVFPKGEYRLVADIYSCYDNRAYYGFEATLFADGAVTLGARNAGHKSLWVVRGDIEWGRGWATGRTACSPAPQEGWVFDGWDWRFFEAGVAHRGWLLDGGWFYFGADGTLATRWLLDDGAWYWLGSDGAMWHGCWLWDGAWYYLRDDGACLFSAQAPDGSWVGADGRWVG